MIVILEETDFVRSEPGMTIEDKIAHPAENLCKFAFAALMTSNLAMIAKSNETVVIKDRYGPAPRRTETRIVYGQGGLVFCSVNQVTPLEPDRVQECLREAWGGLK